MAEQTRALIVSCRENLFHQLETALNGAGIASQHAPSCRAARAILEQADRPALVFSEVKLPDGTFDGIIGVAAQQATPAAVIVISEVMDYQTFLDAIEAGAADFIAPPFSSTDIAWVIGNVLERYRQQEYQVA
jgi:DNA-binding NtrC family response regulator